MTIESINTNDAFYWESPTISLGETPDPLQMESDTKKPLSERAVVHLTEEKTASYKLDNCLNVQSYTDVYLQKTAQAWQAVAELYTTLRTVVCVVAVAAMVVPAVRIAAACIGMVSLIYTTYRISEARSQIDLWSTPPYQKPAEQRTKAYQEPFLSLYAHQLQGVFHPNEVEYLYKKYSSNFCENLLNENPSNDQEKQAWLAKFFTLNPLSRSMMESGLRKISPTFEEINREFAELSSESITPSSLRSKFEAPVFPFKPAAQMGVFYFSSYLHKNQDLVVEYENQLDLLKNEYLYKKTNLKSSYGKRLEQIGSNDLQTLDDQFEYDLKVLKEAYIAEAERLKMKYQENLKAQPTEFCDEDLEDGWDAFQAIFIENKNLTFSENQYAEARSLLERAKKELNPTQIIKLPPTSKPPEKAPEPCADLPDVVECPFS